MKNLVLCQAQHNNLSIELYKVLESKIIEPNSKYKKYKLLRIYIIQLR